MLLTVRSSTSGTPRPVCSSTTVIRNGAAATEETKKTSHRGHRGPRRGKERELKYKLNGFFLIESLCVPLCPLWLVFEFEFELGLQSDRLVERGVDLGEEPARGGQDGRAPAPAGDREGIGQVELV